ncbi:MAG: SDR family NAD(P)-dependent oxidoreductase, partial [Moraxellaceae bacterium]
MYSYSSHEGYTRYASLENRTVFITGGATGIGASLVEAFMSQGSKVAFVDVDAEAAALLCDVLKQQGLACPWFQVCDVSNIDALRASILAAQKDVGDIRVLINNAANDQRYETLGLTEAQWHQG